MNIMVDTSSDVALSYVTRRSRSLEVAEVISTFLDRYIVCTQMRLNFSSLDFSDLKLIHSALIKEPRAPPAAFVHFSNDVSAIQRAQLTGSIICSPTG